jgi:DNA-binding LytR/AlgR family response regulator
MELENCANICRSICKEKQIPAVFATFSNGQTLLFEMMDQAFSAMVNILILEPFNGGEMLAETVRKNGYDGIILYLSRATEKNFFFQAFDANALNFIDKNDLSGLSRFVRVFESALKAAQQQERQYLVFSSAGEQRQIDIRDIYYFEPVMNHMVCVRYAGGEFVFSSSLSSLEARLKGRGFFRIHRACLVALDAVRRVTFDRVTLVNGKEVPIRQGYCNALKEAIDNWSRR